MTGIINVNNPSTTLAVTGTAARVALPVQNASNIRVYYTGTDICYLESGDGTVTASLSNRDTFITAATGVEVFSINPNHTNISAISTGSGGTLYIQQSTGE
jgi:hypothetical protein